MTMGRGRAAGLGVAGLLLLAALAGLAPALLAGANLVVAGPGGEMDLRLEFAPWLSYGFGELRQGRVPLWNPHAFCGVPFLANAETGLLYPPSWLHLLLPFAAAVNLGIVLHVFLAGLGTYLWCRRRGTSRAGAAQAGLVFMFSGSFFGRVSAGHLPHLFTAAWMPLVFLAVDGLRLDGRRRWALLAAFAVAMQLLAGQVQFAYVTALAAAFYLLLPLPGEARAPGTLRWLAGAYLGAVALAAAQVFPEADAVSESLRGGKLPLAAAAAASLPPENLLTLAIPDLFGGLVEPPYYGRWLAWETTLFVGVGGLVLAGCALASAERWALRRALPMTFAFTLLALGSHTPLHRVLHAVLPGFGLFRGPAKYAIVACLFIAALAGAGLDALRRGRRGTRAAAAGAAAAGAALLVLAALAGSGAERGTAGAWGRVVVALERTGESLTVGDLIASGPASVTAAARHAQGRLGLAGGALLLAAALCLLARRRPRLAFGVTVLSAAELLAFAAGGTRAIDPAPPLPDAWRRAIADAGSDGRVLQTSPFLGNLSMQAGGSDLWGYSQLVPRRYAELLAASQGIAPDAATYELAFTRASPLFAMLRCRAILFEEAGLPRAVPFEGALNRAELVGSWRVLAGREAVLAALLDPAFDPRQTVILEEGVEGRGPPGPAGGVTVTRVGPGLVELEARAEREAVLLVTESFSRGWKVEPLPGGSAQERYRVEPANHALCAVRLGPGRHRLRLAYRPASFAAGAAVSLVSLALAAAACARACRRGAGRRHSPAGLRVPGAGAAGAGAAGAPVADSRASRFLRASR